MKRIVLLIALVAAWVASVTAQTSLLATLSHNGQITTYFGSKALQEAYNAAADGDVITLSPGQFESTEITKNITVRGAGMSGNNATVISGAVTLKPSDTEGSKTIEGLMINSSLSDRGTSNTTILKCNIVSYICTYQGTQNFKVIHCEIGDTSGSVNGSYIGCHFSDGSFNNAILENCILEGNRTTSFSSTLVKNSIIKPANTNGFSSSNVFQGCVYIGSNTNPFKNVPACESNLVMPAGTEFLKEGTTTYELRDELQTAWIGTDGRQIGMHGGTLPFDPRTTNPQIKKFDVSAKTSADGKLSVDIEIDAD